MELKRSNRTTELSERHKFVRLWMAGSSARAIAQQTGASATTVCRWIRRWKNEGHVSLRQRRGRPKKDMRWYRFPYRATVHRPMPLRSPAAYSLSLRRPSQHDLRQYPVEQVPFMLSRYSFLYLEALFNKIYGIDGDTL